MALCRRCGGTGLIDRGRDGRECAYCNGTGQVERQLPMPETYDGPCDGELTDPQRECCALLELMQPEYTSFVIVHGEGCGFYLEVCNPSASGRKGKWNEHGHTIAEALAKVKALWPAAERAVCHHERLTEEGICRSCGEDCRGILGTIPTVMD